MIVRGCEFDMKSLNATKWFAPAITAIILFVILFPLIFYGIDYVDQGFHLACQQEMMERGRSIGWMCVFSNCVGGLWQCLSPWGASLCWVYIGGLILWAITGGVVCAVLQQLFSVRAAIIILTSIISIMSLAISQGDLMIHYYTFPMLLWAFWSLFFVLYLKTERYWWLIAMGGVNAMLISARFPCVILCAMPVVYWFLGGITDSNWKISIRPILFWLSGFALGLLSVLLIILFVVGEFDCSSGGAFNLARIANVFATIRGTVISWGGGMGMMVLFYLYVKLRCGKLIFFMSVLLFTCLAVSLGLVFYRHPETVTFLEDVYANQFLYGCGMAIVIFLFWNDDISRNIIDVNKLHVSVGKLLKITVVFVVAEYLFPLGTNTGSTKNYYLLPIVLGIGVLLLYIMNSKQTKHLFICALVVLTCMGVLQNVFLLHWSPGRVFLKSKTVAPQLRQINVAFRDQRIIDETYVALRKYIDPNEELMVTNNHFIWNYLLRAPMFGTFNVSHSLVMPRRLPQNLLLIKYCSGEEISFWQKNMDHNNYVKSFENDYAVLYRKNSR